MRIPLTIKILIETAYVAGGVAITLGVIIGKATIVELLLVVFWEIIFFTLNRFIVIDLLEIVDPGGAIYIHTFGAFFGLGVSWLLSLPFAEVLNSSQDTGKKLQADSYKGNFMSLIGTVVIWALFPSWNAALAPDGTQYRVIINTVIALSGSAVVAALASRTFRGRNYHMKDVQLASLAGGIAIGSAHSTIISPGAALIVGSVAGLITVPGFIFARKWLEGKSPVKVFDTRGAIILHGFCGLMGGLASVIACGGTANGNFYGQESSLIFPRSLPLQGGYQGAAIVITLGISLLSGLVAGLGILFLRRIVTFHTFDTLFTDRREFHVRVGYPEVEFKEP
jgi:ammonium transporter Rh